MKHTLLITLSLFCLSACNNSLTWDKNGNILSKGEIVAQLVSGACKGTESSVRIERLDSVTLKAVWTYTAAEDIDSVSLRPTLLIASPAEWWMIPAVSYNGNEWGRGFEPKGAAKDGIFRSYSCLRTAIPGAVYSENGKYSIASWGVAPTDTSEYYSCSIEPREELTGHCIIWPEQEVPEFYYDRDKTSQGWAHKASMTKGESRSIVMYISISAKRSDHRGISAFLRRAWSDAPKDYATEIPVDSVWNLGVKYFKESLWAEDGIYNGFSIGLLSYPDGFAQRRRGRYESGWCGQNISIGCSMLCDYLNSHDSTSLDKGLRCLDCWARYCPLENGGFITRFDPLLGAGDVADYSPEALASVRMDACNLGTTAMNYFEAADLAQRCGQPRENYRQIAYGICDFALAHQDENGCYARGWKTDGEMIFREGTVGCFLVAPMLKVYQLSGKQEYLRSAIAAYDHYMGELLRDGYTTAGALDTWCIDKESAITLLRASIALYKISGDNVYLDNAVQTSYYLSTWLWHYNAVYPESDQLSRYAFHTLGMTSVSVQHHHLDYYACLWVPEWLELSRLTGDNQWREKALAIWCASCQLISDGNLEINGMVRPAGSQNEAVFQCAWHFAASNNGQDAMPRLNDWLVAWPGAFRLETLRHTLGKIE